MYRLIFILSLLLWPAAGSAAEGDAALQQEVAGAGQDTVTALRKVSDACRFQVRKYWSYEAGQRCKRAVDGQTFPTPELARFIGDLGMASFLVSQTGDGCQKRLQGGQDADKEKPYKLRQCPYQEEAMPRLVEHLDRLDALLATRP